MKVTVIGANGFGKIHMASWNRMGVELEIFSRSQAARDQAASTYGAVKSYSSIDEALSSGAEIVDIILPHNMHRDVAVEAMRRGKHVLLEKPIATDIAEAEEMIAESRKQNVKFMVAEQYYFDSASAWVRDAIASGSVGKVNAVIIRDQRFFAGEGWRRVADVMGGGALVDGGIHYVDTLLNFGGGYSDVKSFTSKGGAPIEEDDTAFALFRFDSGAIGSLFYCWSYRNAVRVPAYEVIGTDGSIVEDMNTKPLVDFKYMEGTRHAFGRPVLNGSVVDIEIGDAFDAEIGGFLASVEKNEKVPFSPELALRDLRAVKDIYSNSSR